METIETLKAALHNAEASLVVAQANLNEANKVCRSADKAVKAADAKLLEWLMQDQSKLPAETVSVAKQIAKEAKEAYAASLPAQAAGNKELRAAQAAVNLARKMLLAELVK